MDMITRAIAQAPLNRVERAILKAFWGIIVAALVQALAYILAAYMHDPTLTTLSWLAVSGVLIKTATDVAAKLLATSTSPIAQEAAPLVVAVGAQLQAEVGANAVKHPN